MCFGHLHFEFFNNFVKSAKFMPQVSVVRTPHPVSSIKHPVSRIENLFMQNKPNFHQNRAIISYGKTKDYKNEPPFLA